VAAHARELFEGQRHLRRSRRDFTNDDAYEAYLRHRWDRPPSVKQEGLRWHVIWDDGDDVWYDPEPWLVELSYMLSQECLASTIWTENGVTPNGLPYGKQIWWRVRLWLDYQQGISKRMKRARKHGDDDEDEDEDDDE